ncbi:MAG TPA: hypothetical protein VFC07_12620, partial [Verrucomicrobiae bacterium]|nr:hypothetical protein [Verrucomicrobiae bacterium]
RYFAFIPSQRLIFFEKDSLFGRDVQLKFPSATNEIRDIGNCMALDLHTAAVFHCMRVVEHGLRALAIHLKVKVKYPLEFAEWGVIIKGIDRKLADLQPKARGKKKAEALEFYRLANDDCNMFKDVWRNSVMHTRGRFPEHEALGVFLRVQSFMQRLSQRNIGEVS